MAYFFAALFGGFFLFNSLATPKKAARAVESSLRRLFPGAQVRAEVQGKRGRDVLRGRFRSARVEMGGFSIAPNTRLKVQVVPEARSLGRVGHLDVVLRDFRWQSFLWRSAEMSLDNVLVDWKALRKSSQLKLVNSPDLRVPRTVGRARVVLGQESLLSWVREKYPDLEGATITLATDSTVRLKGTRALLGAQVPFEVSGRVGLREGRVLEVTQVQVLAGGVPLAGPLAAPFTRSLSSLYELDPQGRWPLAVSGAALKVEDTPRGTALVLDAQISLKTAAAFASAQAALQAQQTESR